MIKYKCLTCLGKYYDSDENGTPYYHVCPRVRVSEDEMRDRDNKRDERPGHEQEGLGREVTR